MKSLLFIQVSSELINGPYKATLADKYYQSIYETKDGYDKGKHFWEVPLWIAEIDGYLSGYMNTDFRVIDSNEPMYLQNEYDYILFSVMDVNKKYIQSFVNQYKGNAEILTGGYTRIEGLKYFNSPESLANYLDIPYKYALNYQHFKDIRTIPRLTLSKGCKHKCKFCTIPSIIEQKSNNDILCQAQMISRDLHFKYVYISDPTYGQANNHTILKQAYDIILWNNPEFVGFIVQTTASQLNKPGFIESLPGLGVRIVEIGMETHNDKILRHLRKPASEKLILKAINGLKAQDIDIILNVIIGLLGESEHTYNNTLRFIDSHKYDIFALNVYNLALYPDSELGQEIGVQGESDINEYELSNFGNKKATEYFYNSIFELGLEILQNETILA